MAPDLLEGMHGMVLDQPLVIGQVSHCTDEGCTPVYMISSYLVVGISHILIISTTDI